MLTNDQGSDTAAAVRDAVKVHRLRPDTLILAATLKALPPEQPAEPCQGEGRGHRNGAAHAGGGRGLFLLDGPTVSSRPGPRPRAAGPQPAPGGSVPGLRKALVVSNPGGGLPLLETFSRHTTRELKNAGYETTAWFGDDVSKEAMRKALPAQDLFLWEGHYKTLIDEFEFLTWKEPLPPALFFLQSCLALKEEEAGPLIRRGAIAVVGSSTRTYSATGGAFTLAFFDALLYDQQTLGGALRQAKNFLLSYSLLKEKRLGDKAKLKGVNVRSAWAFTLWGDPTLRLPPPPIPAGRLDAVRHTLRGTRLTLTLPEAAYERIVVGNYEAQMLPNARLAGLVGEGVEEGNKALVPFVFAEIPLLKAKGRTPTLTSRIPERNWVFSWDARRECGYLLVTPRPRPRPPRNALPR